MQINKGMQMYAGVLKEIKYTSERGNALTKFAFSLSDETVRFGTVHFWIPRDYLSRPVVITSEEKPLGMPGFEKHREHLIPGKLVRLPGPDAFGNTQRIERDEKLPAIHASRIVVGKWFSYDHRYSTDSKH